MSAAISIGFIVRAYLRGPTGQRPARRFGIAANGPSVRPTAGYGSGHVARPGVHVLGLEAVREDLVRAVLEEPREHGVAVRDRHRLPREGQPESLRRGE